MNTQKQSFNRIVVEADVSDKLKEYVRYIRQLEKDADEYRAWKRREKSDPAKDRHAALEYADDAQMWAAYFLGHYFRTRPHEYADWEYTPPAQFHSEIFRLCKDRQAEDWFDDDQNQKRGIIIAAPRGFSKSTIVSLFIVLWWAYTKRRRFVILLSNTDPQAVQLVENIKTEVEQNERLRNAYGVAVGDAVVRTISGRKLAKEKWSGHDFSIVLRDDKGNPLWTTRIMAKGAGGKLRGFRVKEQRPDAIIIDDVENDENVETKLQRDKIHNWIMGAIFPMMDLSTGIFIMIGTVLHDDSVLNRLLKKGKERNSVFLTRTWRAINEDGSALWPERFSIARIGQIRRSMTVLKFNQEYMNDPRDPATNVFKPEDIRWWKLSELRLDRKTGLWLWNGIPLFITQGVDPAIAEAEDRGRDAEEKSQFAHLTVGAARYQGRPRLFILRAYATDMDFPDQVKLIRQEWRHWQPEKVAIETNNYQLSLKQHLTSIAPHMPILKIKHTSRDNKEKRIIATSFLFEQGVVFMRASDEDEPGELDELRRVRVHPSQRQFYDDLVRFPRIGRFDLLDAWEMAVQAQTGKRSFADWVHEESA